MGKEYIAGVNNIAKWALSCKTLKQIKSVAKFYNNYCKRMDNCSKYISSEDLNMLYYRAGLCGGIIIGMINVLKHK